MTPVLRNRPVPGWLTTLAYVAVVWLAFATPAAAQDSSPPPTGFGGGGVTAPDTGTRPDARQPDPQPAPSPGYQPAGGAGYQPGQPVEIWSPASFYTAARVQLGTEVFEDQPGLKGPGVFAFGFGVEVGVSLNFTPWARLTFVPFSLDFISSTFSYDHPDTSQAETDSIFGSRITLGFLLDVGPVHFGVRYGERSYWTNKKVGAANISLIGNDFTRNVFDLSIGYIADILIGYVHLGASFEFPLDSKASKYSIFFDIAVRFYFP